MTRVRRVEISDTPLTFGERARLWARRVWRRSTAPSEPVRGRLQVIQAQEAGRLIPPDLLVHAVPPGNVVTRARPEARLSLRIYRAATGEWSEPIRADSVDVMAVPKGE